jgi:hypothetical protein
MPTITTLLIEADRVNVDHCMAVADHCASVSGLVFKWDGMDAVYIEDKIIPVEFDNLNWN